MLCHVIGVYADFTHLFLFVCFFLALMFVRFGMKSRSYMFLSGFRNSGYFLIRTHFCFWISDYALPMCVSSCLRFDPYQEL